MDNDFKNLFGDWEPKDDLRLPGSEPPEEVENRAPRALNEKEVKVVAAWERQGIPNVPAQTFVVMQDNQGRKVCIFIGRHEAFSISQFLEGEETERPLTYDLMSILMERLGGTVERVIIDDIWQDTFYAKISLVKDGQTMDIDCRPSDAINVALRAKAPIYMAEAVIEASQVEI